MTGSLSSAQRPWWSTKDIQNDIHKRTGRQNKSYTPQKQPFIFCANLCVLAACAAHLCPQCETTRTYIVSNESLKRKKRQPKASDSTEINHSKIKFAIGKGRTAKHKNQSFRLPQAYAVNSKGSKWCTDSGATVSVTNRLELFESIEQWNPGVHVQVANKHSVQVSAVGTIRLTLHDRSGQPCTVLLSNVHYSPQFSGNLLSIGELHRQHGWSTIFKGRESSFLTADEVELPISLDNGRSYSPRMERLVLCASVG